MAQAKFVFKKALELELPAIICVNKVDRPESRPMEVVDEVLELFMELDANEIQLDSPFIFASARAGKAGIEPDQLKDNMHDLFEKIVEHIPAPVGDLEGTPQILISTIDYNEYVGRIGVGKVQRGTIKTGNEMYVVNYADPEIGYKARIGKVYDYIGLNRVEVESADVGNIIAIAGIENINIGDTITDINTKEALPFVKISEPTIAMTFSINDSPFAGREGKFVTSRQLRDRLMKELKTNVALRVEETDTADTFKVSGRGELHLTILMETMRREGYEFQVSKPEVLFKRDEKGNLLEPIERVIIDVPNDFMGPVMEKLGSRKGEMVKEKWRIYAHYYYNDQHATDDKIRLNKLLDILEGELTQGKHTPEHEHLYEKYFQTVATPVRGVWIQANQDAIDKSLKDCGYFVLLSNDIKDPVEALEIYRAKDLIEKAFGDLKERLNMRRESVASEENLEGKLFVQFVALIFMSYIKKAMDKGGLFKNRTLQELIDDLDVIERYHQPGKKPKIGEITTKQKTLYAAMEVECPV